MFEDLIASSLVNCKNCIVGEWRERIETQIVVLKDFTAFL